MKGDIGDRPILKSGRWVPRMNWCSGTINYFVFHVARRVGRGRGVRYWWMGRLRYFDFIPPNISSSRQIKNLSIPFEMAGSDYRQTTTDHLHLPTTFHVFHVCWICHVVESTKWRLRLSEINKFSWYGEWRGAFLITHVLEVKFLHPDRWPRHCSLRQTDLSPSASRRIMMCNQFAFSSKDRRATNTKTPNEHSPTPTPTPHIQNPTQSNPNHRT